MEKNPTKFNYKLIGDDNIKTINIDLVKEFAIYKNIKYIRQNVKIDRSSSFNNRLSDKRNPLWSEETLFLKVLVENTASLYYFEDGEVNRYFFKMGNDSIQQLIYKKYTLDKFKVYTNDGFRQQLFFQVNCESKSLDKLMAISYNKDLIKYFEEYNVCKGYISNSDSLTKSHTSKKRFNGRLLLGLASNRLTIDNPSSSASSEFDNKLNLRFGVDVEYILPFNKNKWTIFIQPTYKNYKESNSIPLDELNVKYSSLEIPIGLRYYFFLNSSWKLFVNSAVIIEVAGNSAIEAEKGVYFDRLDIQPRPNLTFGVGINYKKISSEFRLFSSRNVLGNYVSWSSDFTQVSFLLGYKIF